MNVVDKRALGSSRDTDGGHKTTIAIHAIAELTAGEFVSMILNTMYVVFMYFRNFSYAHVCSVTTPTYML